MYCHYRILSISSITFAEKLGSIITLETACANLGRRKNVTIRPVSIETESLKYNDVGLIRGTVNGENTYPSDPLINIHCRARLIPAAT
ncbi:hypothetical protein TNCV_3243781 [Trichonephila clavipes]|nr:hypothetical protein TNCV_3243781 [Trichonephila clavipes]